jgi:hypothetical protein
MPSLKNKGIFGCCNGADISVDLKGFNGEIFLKVF